MGPEFADSLLPIAEAGLHQLVDANHIITEEISLFPTPGHIPSHASVTIRSQGILYQRFASRGEADYQNKVLSAMRYGFGGHLEKAAAK